jgi:uncharacterized repeat protein (TIGR03943 family)
VIRLTARSGRLTVLVVWAAFLLWLQAADQVPRYLGPRTAWIVPVGGIALALAALGYARWTVRAPVASLALSLRESAGLAAVLAPVLVGLCMGNATLGSLAASNKLSSRGVDLSRLAGSLAKGSGKIDFLVIRGAEEDPDMARQRGIVPGTAVSLTGFVLTPAAADGAPLRLARFYMTCCVADSVAIDVPVYPVRNGSAFPRDSWVQASGVLERRGDKLVVAGARLTPVDKPKHPYLWFTV